MQQPSKSPEQWLESISTEKQTGLFKLFLGYAPGVGKTFNMLSEAIRRRDRGEDIVIGVVETHGRPRTAELAAQLETLPLRPVLYKGVEFLEMDVDAILARKPQIVLIDELAHTNVGETRHSKRFEDVLEVLASGIDVLTTLNVQHIESVSPTVQSVTGIQIRETVPDWVIRRADEIVMADLTPEALQTRMNRGDIYPTDRVERALANFFRRGNLIALRELALQHVTQAVDRTLTDYMDRKRIGANWAVRERVAVCISSSASARELIVRGSRLVEAVGGDFYVVHVDTGRKLPEEAERTLASSLKFAESLKAKVVHVKGRNVASAAAQFVRERRITQVIFGRSAVSGIRKYLYYWAIQNFLKQAPAVDVHIVTQNEQSE